MNFRKTFKTKINANKKSILAQNFKTLKVAKGKNVKSKKTRDDDEDGEGVEDEEFDYDQKRSDDEDVASKEEQKNAENEDSEENNSKEDILQDEEDDDPNLSDTGKAIQKQIKTQLKDMKSAKYDAVDEDLDD